MRLTLAVVVVLAIALRLLASFGYYRAVLHVDPRRDSTDGYHQVAESLASGYGFRTGPADPPDVRHPPAYPFLLSLVLRASGGRYEWVQVTQAVMGGLGCLLLWALGRWVHSARLGVVMAALYAVYPNALDYSARLFSENLFFVLTFALVLLLVRAAHDRSPATGVALGALWGLALLTRATLMFLPLALAVGLALSPSHRARVWRWALPALLAGVLVVAPWTARNHRVTGHVIPVATHAWFPLYQGIHCTRAMIHGGDVMRADQAAAREILGRVSVTLAADTAAGVPGRTDPALERERVARELAMAEFAREPLGVLQRAVVGVPYAWYQTYRPALRRVSLLVHLPLMALFVFGVWWMRRAHPDSFRRAWPALVAILYVNVFQAVIYPQSRYMAPMVAVSFLFSGLVLLDAWDGWRRREKRLESPSR